MPLPIPPEDLPPIDRLREIVRLLRAPGGCPWDIEQTHETLIPCLLEEAYEVAEAIREGDDPHLCEELGDLLLQAVIHAEVARGEGRFDLDDVARGISEKLIRRHPHVFADSAAGNTEAVLAQWDEIKKAEKGHDAAPAGYLDGVGKGLPALTRGVKLTKKAAKVGFEWDEIRELVDKMDEEMAEVKEAFEAREKDPDHLDEEIGDLFFVMVNFCRRLGRDPESLIDAANAKFVRRFHQVEQGLLDKGRSLKEADLAEMEQEWVEVKRKER